MDLRLRLFGSPAVLHDGAHSALPFERRSQLLAFLALKRGWVARTDIAALLWPDQERKLAFTNLRKILFRLQSMRWASGIELEGGAMRFDVATDVAEFEAALADGRIADALALRSGELLDGFDDGESEPWSSWLGFERDRLRSAWRGAALARLDDDIDAAEAIALSAALLETDPLDEAALRAHMTWLAASGQGARAREKYREFAARLAQDLGIDPGAELTALHDSIAGATRGLRATPAAPAKAAVSDSDFVGRSVELKRIGELLGRDECRLLSIVGPGGVGKTRLAHRVLDAHGAEFADGDVFVALEDVAATEGLDAHLAREIGVESNAGGDPIEPLIEFLRERRMLVVLDNFEHLQSAAPIVSQLVSECPHLKIVVTSRARLGQPSEWVLPLEGLPCPEAEDEDRIEAFDAARLFINAAQRVAPGWMPSAEALAIVDICRQVDGLPLALELAAAWTRVLSCAAIAQELKQGFELLRAVDPAKPARHASFEVVFDQSWRLLGPHERDILARLAVFRGGFTVEAARAVAGASFPVLGALTDKSLLRKDDDARLSLHPLVHQLTRLRLDQSDAREATEKSHALYFLRLLAELRRAIESGNREAMQRIDVEFENCRNAWRWAVRNGAMDLLRNSMSSLIYFCDHRERHADVLGLLSDVLAMDGIAEDPGFHALTLARTAHAEYRQDRYAEATATASRALAIARGVRDPAIQMQAFQVLGACALRQGDHDNARGHFRKSLQHALASGEPRKVGVMLANLALVEKAIGNYDEALKMSIEALSQYRRIGDVAGEALSLNNLGVLYSARRDFAPAAEHLKAALTLCDRHGLSSTRVLALANLTDIAIEMHDDRSAAGYASRTLELARAAGNRVIAATIQLQLVRIAIARHDVAAARTHLAEALETVQSIGRPALQLEAVLCFSDVLAEQGAPDCAARVLALAARDPALVGPERHEIDLRAARLPPVELPADFWPAFDLRQLVHRIIVETNAAYAPLIATLRQSAGSAADSPAGAASAGVAATPAHR